MEEIKIGSRIYFLVATHKIIGVVIGFKVKNASIFPVVKFGKNNSELLIDSYFKVLN